ncbi:MAG: urease accessory protein UreE [Pseudomonadales bacterium]
MIEVHTKATTKQFCEVDDIIELDHIQREKGRLKVTSKNGEEVRLFLERGKLLVRDQVLQSDCNKLLKVSLAKERVVTVRTNSWPIFSRACYHLGNRHVRMQIGDRWLRFLEDPVLIELVEMFGLTTEICEDEFEPESGAYGHGQAGKPLEQEHQHAHKH